MWPYPWTHVGTPSHLGHIDRVAATMPSQAHAGAAQEAPDIGQWEGQDVPLVRPSSCNVKRGIPSSRRYLPTLITVSDPSSFGHSLPQTVLQLHPTEPPAPSLTLSAEVELLPPPPPFLLIYFTSPPPFFDAWGLPPGEHYSKRPNHGQERSWRAEVESKKKYIQQIVYEPVLVSTWALTRNIWVQCTALFGTRGQKVT